MAVRSLARPGAELILSILSEEGGNIRKTADRLLISRQQLYRHLEALPDFDLEAFRQGLPNRPPDKSETKS